MEENERINIRPDQIHISDIGRVITSVPRALLNTIKRNLKQHKIDRAKAREERRNLREQRKISNRNRRKNSKVRKFFAGIINENPKAAEKIAQRETERDTQDEEETEEKTTKKGFFARLKERFTKKKSKKTSKKSGKKSTEDEPEQPDQPEQPEPTKEDKVLAVFHFKPTEKVEVLTLLNRLIKANKDGQTVDLETSKRLFKLLDFNRKGSNNEPIVEFFNGEPSNESKGKMLSSYPQTQYLVWEMTPSQKSTFESLFNSVTKGVIEQSIIESWTKFIEMDNIHSMNERMAFFLLKEKNRNKTYTEEDMRNYARVYGHKNDDGYFVLPSKYRDVKKVTRVTEVPKPNTPTPVTPKPVAPAPQPVPEPVPQEPITVSPAEQPKPKKVQLECAQTKEEIMQAITHPKDDRYYFIVYNHTPEEKAKIDRVIKDILAHKNTESQAIDFLNWYNVSNHLQGETPSIKVYSTRQESLLAPSEIIDLLDSATDQILQENDPATSIIHDVSGFGLQSELATVDSRLMGVNEKVKSILLKGAAFGCITNNTKRRNGFQSYLSQSFAEQMSRIVSEAPTTEAPTPREPIPRAVTEEAAEPEITPIMEETLDTQEATLDTRRTIKVSLSIGSHPIGTKVIRIPKSIYQRLPKNKPHHQDYTESQGLNM